MVIIVRAMYKTAAWAVWITSLTIIPMVSKIGTNRADWRRIVVQRR